MDKHSNLLVLVVWTKEKSFVTSTPGYVYDSSEDGAATPITNGEEVGPISIVLNLWSKHFVRVS